jgi:glycosyltransferase involved in cell wall biosynthesis
MFQLKTKYIIRRRNGKHRQVAPKVSVIVPVCNEANRLNDCIMKLEQALQNLSVDFEIVISEDGSVDGTDKIAADWARRDSAVKHLHSSVRLGRGKAVQRGFEASDGSIVVYTDADLSTDLRHLGELVKAIDSGADIVTGSRLSKGSIVTRSFSRELLSRFYNGMVKLAFKSPIHDYQCGFKAFRKGTVASLLDEVKEKHWSWDTELLIRAVNKGYIVVEIPVTWVQSEGTKVRPWTDIRQMSAATLRLWRQLRSEKQELMREKPKTPFNEP